MEASRKIILQISNMVIPLICMIILGIISIGKGDYRQIFVQGGYDSLIDPIGFAFAIWGPIFFFLIIFVLYQARDLFKGSDDKIDMPYVEEISIYFILSTIATSLWYAAWLSRIIWLATISMVAYLLFLIIGYLRLDINKKDRPRLEFIAVTLPWSLYTGWVTAATIVSLTTFFQSIGFNDPIFLFSDIIWAIIVLLVTLVIYLLMLLTRNDYIYAGVGIWVLIGILSERIIAPILVWEVIIICIIGIIILAIAIIFQIYKNKK